MQEKNTPLIWLMIGFQKEPKNTTYLKLYTRFQFQNPLSFFLFSIPNPAQLRIKGTSKHSKGQNSLAERIACENKIASFLVLPSYSFFLSFFKAQQK